MKKYIKPLGTLSLSILLLACGEEQKLDQLRSKKNALKSELASIEAQIKALDVNSNGMLDPLVVLGALEQKKFQHKILVQGNVETDEDVLLNAELGGQITAVLVKEGQSVSVGQTLVVLDGSMINSNMQELETQMEYAQYMLDKQEELKRRGVGSEFDYKTARNQVDALKSRMKSLSTQRGKTSIKAPFSGVIDKVFAKTGQVAGPASPLMRLVNNREINITADISEKHLEHIKTGTEVRVRFPNYKDTVVKLEITRIGNYIDPTNRTFRISANMKNNRAFLPNMLAELEIIDREQEGAMVIPSRAILKSQKNEDFIYVAESKGGKKYKLRRVNVELVDRYNGEAWINIPDHGIKTGSKVVVQGARGVSEGDLVRVK